MILLLPLALLLAGSPDSAQLRLLSDCSDSSEPVASLSLETPIMVVSSYAGGAPCYAVIATTPQGPLRGFTNNAEHPAIQAFERDRQASFASKLIVPAQPEPIATATPAAAPPPPPAAIAKATRPSMAGVSFKDINGKDVAINAGGLTLLFFWVPDDPHSEANLRRITLLQERYASAGLKVIGIGEGASNAQMRDYFDERARTFPQVADDSSSLERKLRIPTRPGAAILGADRSVLAVSSNFASIEADLSRFLRNRSHGEQP
jgi:hypothetical protein